MRAYQSHTRNLWAIADSNPGDLRASVFEFRPYPGTPIWTTLTGAGHRPEQLLDYADVDLTGDGAEESMRQRDEFNFSVGIQSLTSPWPRSALPSPRSPASSTNAAGPVRERRRDASDRSAGAPWPV